MRFTDLDGAGPPHDRPPALVVPILKVVRDDRLDERRRYRARVAR